MTQYNDELRSNLAAKGYNTGSLVQDLYRYFRTYTSSSVFRDMNGLERRFLITVGIAPNVSLTKMWNDLFAVLGFTGSFSDKKLKWAMMALP